ncbi:acyl carrier protein [Streptomyces sp. NPDC087425]|uniref:acyl carrier protein n=1 Tax=Streptomyces sp. NPDC087425 TaxID=3365787 RepID=UPI003826AC88
MSHAPHRACLYAFIEAELIDFGAQPEMISDDATINALDIDSLSIVELMSSIQRNHSVEIPREEISRDTTIAGLVAMICARTGVATAESDGRAEPAVPGGTPGTAVGPAAHGPGPAGRRIRPLPATPPLGSPRGGPARRPAMASAAAGSEGSCRAVRSCG